MKQSSNFKGRPRGRNYNNNSNKRNFNNKTSFDSNSKIGKIRGNANQVMEKYLLAAKDALSKGDRLLAEQCYQYAEHYYRIHQINIKNNQKREKTAANPIQETSVATNTDNVVVKTDNAAAKTDNTSETPVLEETVVTTEKPEKDKEQKEKPRRIRKVRKARKAKKASLDKDSKASLDNDSNEKPPKTLTEVLSNAPKAEIKEQNESTDIDFSWTPSDIKKEASVEKVENIN